MSLAIGLTVFVFIIAATLVILFRLGALQIKLSPVTALLGAWLLFMAIYTVFGRLLVEADGTVITRTTTCNSRCETLYVMKAQNGHSFSLISGPTDESLSRDFPVGSRITKRKWDLGYTLNGHRVSDFSITFYGIMFAFGASFLCFSILLIIHRRGQASGS